MKTLKTRTYCNEELIVYRERVRIEIEGRRIMIVGSRVWFLDSEVPFFHVDFYYKGCARDMKWKKPVAAYRKIMKVVAGMYERAHDTGCDLVAYPADEGRGLLYIREMRKRGMVYIGLDDRIMFHP